MRASSTVRPSAAGWSPASCRRSARSTSCTGPSTCQSWDGEGRTRISTPSPSLTRSHSPDWPTIVPGRMLDWPRNPATKALAGWLYTVSGESTCSTWPRFITTTRSDTASASAWSCVANTVVMPHSRWKCLNSRRMALRRRSSMAANGSSSSHSAGRMANARARATHCCWPRESAAGMACSRPGRRTRARASRTRSFTRSCGRPR